MAYTAQPAGFLADTIQRIYDYTNEPDENPKWTTDKLFPLIRGSYGRCMLDVNGVGQNPIVVRFDITTTATQRTYMLPPNVGQVIAIGKVNSQTGEFYERIIPRTRLSPFMAGVTFEGPLVRFEPIWGVAETLRVLYIPNGDCALHLGTVAEADTTTTSVKINIAPTEGYFDRRPNAYLGSMLRLLSATVSSAAAYPSGYTYYPIQERPITGMVPTSLVATVDTAFDFDPATAITGSAIHTYEIVPFMGDLFQDAIAWDVAAMVNGTEKRYTEKADCMKNRLNQMRMIRQNLSHYNSRSGTLLRSGSFATTRWGWTV